MTPYDSHIYNLSIIKNTEDAQLLALAHKICLIDLGSDRENGIKKIIEGYVSNIYKDIDSEYDKKYHNVQEERKEEYRSKKFQEIKNNFRSFEMTNNPDKSKYPEIEKLYKAVENKAIYIANIGCPQIITLLPEDNNMFKEALKKNPHQDISISYEKENEDYIIKPKSGEESEYCLSFRLQKVFSKALISELGGKNIPSKMSFIAYLDGKNPELCTLKFNKEEMIACIKEAKKRNSTK